MNKKESAFNIQPVVHVLDNKMLVLLDPFEYNAPNEVFKNRSREQKYGFDYIFDENASQVEIFESTTKPLIKGLLEGYNATVFAYGATGAGKTYTMIGSEECRGNMALTLEELFVNIELQSEDKEFKVSLVYLEIYNENLRDLLNPSNENIDIREDPAKGVMISNVTELPVTSCKDIFALLKY